MEFNPLVRAVCTVALAATAFFTVAAFMQLPADAVLAIHWNINSVADGFAGREALLIVPITTVVVGGLLWLAVRNDPKRANIARSADALGLVVMALALLVADIVVHAGHHQDLAALGTDKTPHQFAGDAPGHAVVAADIGEAAAGR